MNAQFIILPSGTAVNTAHIISARREDNGLAIFTTEGPFMAPEDLTMEAFLALLSPPSSPIVDSVVNLDRLKPGSACQFTFEGVVKHGVIEGILIGEDAFREAPYISISSSGKSLSLYLTDHKIVDITEFQQTDT